MKVIIGLWNPWEKYTLTRHNIGFLFVDFFAKKENFSEWKYESKFLAEISEGSLNWEKIVLVKPQTYMNLSGTSVQKILQFYKIDCKDITVIYDDKDMVFWKVRVRQNGSAGWHNGVKDIMRYLWDKWDRIKIWVGKTPDNLETPDWVLSKFSEEERIDLDNTVLTECYNELIKILEWKKYIA